MLDHSFVWLALSLLCIAFVGILGTIAVSFVAAVRRADPAGY